MKKSHDALRWPLTVSAPPLVLLVRLQPWPTLKIRNTAAMKGISINITLDLDPNKSLLSLQHHAARKGKYKWWLPPPRRVENPVKVVGNLIKKQPSVSDVGIRGQVNKEPANATQIVPEKWNSLGCRVDLERLGMLMTCLFQVAEVNRRQVTNKNVRVWRHSELDWNVGLSQLMEDHKTYRRAKNLAEQRGGIMSEVGVKTHSGALRSSITTRFSRPFMTSLYQKSMLVFINLY